ncbi:hypothetical protein CYY_008169 [Polysphondylium violaceum]|uniref:Transcription initiation factor TFIID subunit 1 n=1 Tax=Polysphondylium violaceum TaxID=133409 RepID=A0A8J4PNB3_9MYCE|nr:hypothetical protein CYY_008169 [Polysphondylium violaceum]
MAKEKGGISGFLFGNVNESGELDIDENDGFFDKDLKKDLELFAKKGHITLKNLGIDEDDNSGNANQQAASIVVPDKNARDYEDEEELAEEVYNVENEINKLNADKLARQAEANIAQLAKQRQDALYQQQQQQQQQKSKKKKQKEKKNIEDFDFDEEEEEEDSDMSSSSSDSEDSSDEEKRKKVTMKSGSYQVVKSLLEAPFLFSSEDLEFKTFISGKTGDGLILKFSQVFAPKIDKPMRRKSRRFRSQPPTQITNDLLDNDEVSVWNQPSKKQAPPKKPYRLDLQSKEDAGLSLSASTTPTLGSIQTMMPSNMAFQEDEDDYVPEPMKDKQDQELLDTFYDLPDSDFQCLQQIDWEEDIIWDGDDFELVVPNNKINQVALSLFYLDPIDNTLSLLKLSNDDSNSNSNSNNSVVEIDKDVNLDNSSSNSSSNVKDTDSSIVKNKPRQLWGSLTSEASIIGRDDNLQIHNGKEKADSNSNNNNNNNNNDEDIKFGDDLLLPPKSEKEKEKEKKEKREREKREKERKEKERKEKEEKERQQLENEKQQQQQKLNNNNNNNNNNNAAIVDSNTYVQELESKVDKWSLFPVQNEELESGEWIENIIWDESMLPSKMAELSVLILDLNDREMLFDEHIERKVSEKDTSQDQQTPVKKKSKKRLAMEAAQAAQAAAAAAAAAQAAQSSTAEEKERVEAEKREREEREQTEREVDKFNLSNDKYYKPVRSVKQPSASGRSVIQHSLPGIKLSLVKTHLTKEDLIHAHRPKIIFPLNNVYRVAFFHKQEDKDANGNPLSASLNSANGLNSSRKSINRTETIKHKSDLSGREGRVVLVEYIEQNPPLISNVGMGMRIKNFYRKKNANDTHPLLNFEDGENILLDHNDETPFLGDIHSGTAVQGIVNNLYKAPLFKHTASGTDFLLVRSRDGKRWYVRDLGAVYTAGQTLPEVEIPAPNSRSANMVLKSRLQAYIYRLFLKKSNTQHRVKIVDVCSAFPSQSETSIRKRLKDCADFQRGGDDSGWWTVKDKFPLPTEDELQKLVTPEIVCAYESMLVGLQRLQDNGIIHFTAPGTIPTILGNFDDEDPIKKKFKPVEDELSITPWNLTSSFISSMQGKGKLQLLSEDSNGREDEFVFLKMPQKVVNQKQKAIKQALQKNQVTGTDADLRKLSLKASKTVLLELGVSEETINKLTRWQRIDLVRKKSSEVALASGGDNAAMTKFARGSRYSLDHQNLQYKEQCQLIFDNQMRSLSGFADEDLDADLEDLQKDLEESLFNDNETNSTSNKNNNKANGKKQQQQQQQQQNNKRARGIFDKDDEEDFDEDEEEEYNKLMEMTNQSSTPSTPAPPNINNSSASVNTDIAKSSSSINPTTTTTTTTTTTSTTTTSTNPDEEDLTTGDHIFVKRTTLFQKPDGSLYKRIEIIRDPKVIKDYQKKKPDQYQQDRKKFGNPNAEDEEAKRIKRLQDRLKRLKTNPREDSFSSSSSSLSSSFGGNATNSNNTIGSISNSGINNHGKPIPPNQQQKINIVLPSNPELLSNGPKIRISTSSLSQNNNTNSNNASSSSSNHKSSRDHNRDSRDRESHRDNRERDHHSSSRDRDRDRESHRDRDRDRERDRHHSSSTREHSGSSSSSSSGGNRDHHHHHSSSRDRDRDRERDRHHSSREHRDREHHSSSSNHHNDHHKEQQHQPNDQSPTLSQSGSIILRIKKEDIPQQLRNSGSSSINNNNSNSGTNKRKLDESFDDLNKSSNNRRNRVRKDGSGAEVELANIFEKIIEKLRSMDEFVAFKHKVSPKVAPDYHLVIKNPIDLTTMRDKNRSWEYKNKNQFLDAIKLMVANCHEYNEKRFSHLLPIADKLLNYSIQLLREHDIDTLEKSIEQSATPKVSSSNLIGASSDSTPATPITNPMSPHIPISVDSPFFPPVSKAQNQEDEEIDIVSIYSGASPSI